MATPTGTIGMNNVIAELGISGQTALGDTDVRGLAGRPTGQISMNDLRGKSNGILYNVLGDVFREVNSDKVKFGNRVGYSSELSANNTIFPTTFGGRSFSRFKFFGRWDLAPSADLSFPRLELVFVGTAVPPNPSDVLLGGISIMGSGFWEAPYENIGDIVLKYRANTINDLPQITQEVQRIIDIPSSDDKRNFTLTLVP